MAIQTSIGDIVSIQEPNLPRGSWRLGRIQELIQSGDEAIRSAKIRLPNGKLFTRAIKMLYPLEIPQEKEPERRDEVDGGEESERRGGKEE